MNELVDKYKDVLLDFDKKNHNRIASLLEVVVNYINYKYSEENINFKVTAAYLIVMLFEETHTQNNNIYETIDKYKTYFDDNFKDFHSDDNINAFVDEMFVNKYINEVINE